MKIALIGDLHFFRLWVWPWQMFSKRLLGQTNLWLNRRTHFVLRRIEQLTERIEQIEPDLLLCSGDLTTTALKREFQMAHDALSPLLKRYRTIIVPGNHDRHTFTAARDRILERHFSEQSAEQYPHLHKLRKDLYLIGLDPTRPNIITDRGRLGRRQRHDLQQMLTELPAEAQLIVLCHYTLGMPPGVKPERASHAMIDADELRQLLRGDRPTLYLHGHVHLPFCWRPADAPNILAIDAGAPLMHDHRWPHGQGFWEIDLTGPLTLTHHDHEPDRGWVAKPVEVPTEPGGAVTFI